jgi:hypothetical protein
VNDLEIVGVRDVVQNDAGRIVRIIVMGATFVYNSTVTVAIFPGMIFLVWTILLSINGGQTEAKYHQKK